MRTRYPVVQGQTAPVTLTLVEVDSDTNADPFPVDLANSFEGRAQPVGGGATVVLPVSLLSAADKTLALDASALAVGAWAVQIRFNDTAGDLHIAPNDGDGFRLEVAAAY